MTEEQELEALALEFPEFEDIIRSVISKKKDQRMQDLFESAQYNPSNLGPASPRSSGVPQYAAQDRPVVDTGNMPGRTLDQGQPQTTSLMNIGSTLPPLHLIQRRRFG